MAFQLFIYQEVEHAVADQFLVSQAIGKLARTPQRPGTPPVLMTGIGLQFWLQDLTQLRAGYGQNAGTFLANAGLIQVSVPADLKTAQWLSRLPGNAFRSTPEMLASTGARGSTSQEVSEQVAARPLLAPDEAMRLSSHVQVLPRPGHTPAPWSPSSGTSLIRSSLD